MNIYTTIDSPIGRLLLHSDGAALTGLYMDVPSRPPRGMDEWVEDAGSGPLPDTIRQLDEYFAGCRRTFDLPLKLYGTEFQQRVWNVLSRGRQCRLVDVPQNHLTAIASQPRSNGETDAACASCYDCDSVCFGVFSILVFDVSSHHFYNPRFGFNTS